jgi:hypothetical protein
MYAHVFQPDEMLLPAEKYTNPSMSSEALNKHAVTFFKRFF